MKRSRNVSIRETTQASRERSRALRQRVQIRDVESPLATGRSTWSIKTWETQARVGLLHPRSKSGWTTDGPEIIQIDNRPFTWWDKRTPLTVKTSWSGQRVQSALQLLRLDVSPLEIIYAHVSSLKYGQTRTLTRRKYGTRKIHILDELEFM